MAADNVRPNRPRDRGRPRLLVALAGLALAGCGVGTLGSAHGDKWLSDEAQVFLVDVRTSHRTALTSAAAEHFAPAWSADGRRISSVAAMQGGPFAIEVTTDRGQIWRRRGLPACGGEAAAGFAVWASAATELAVECGSHAGVFDAAARQIRTLRGVGGQLALSPDGRRLAFSTNFPGQRPEVPDQGPQLELSVAALPSGKPRRLTSTPGDEVNPLWSPDNRQVLFQTLSASRLPTDPPEVLALQVRSPGSHSAKTLARMCGGSVSWAPDSRRVAVADLEPGKRGCVFSGRPGLQVLDARSGVHKTLLAGPVGSVAWSPDGRLIAFVNGDRIEVTQPSGAARRSVVDSGGGEILELAWSPDSQRLAFTARRTREP